MRGLQLFAAVAILLSTEACFDTGGDCAERIAMVETGRLVSKRDVNRDLEVDRGAKTVTLVVRAGDGSTSELATYVIKSSDRQ